MAQTSSAAWRVALQHGRNHLPLGSNVVRLACNVKMWVSGGPNSLTTPTAVNAHCISFTYNNQTSRML